MELRGCGKYKDTEGISISVIKKVYKRGTQRGEGGSEKRVWQRQIGREGCREEQGWLVGYREGGELQGCDFAGNWLIIDREAREIMYLVASVCPSVSPSVRLSPLSRLNRLTYDLDIRYVG